MANNRLEKSRKNRKNHIRGTVFKLLYMHNSNDPLYFHCSDEEQFYPFEILAFRTLKLQLFRVVVFAFNVCMLGVFQTITKNVFIFNSYVLK